MKVKIKVSTLENMTGMTFENNKMAFAAELKRNGMRQSEKTIIRALEGRNDKDENVGPYISDKISLPVLIRMCENYDFPFCRCFTFYSEQGEEKTPSASAIQAIRTDKPIKTNFLRMAYDICQLFPRLQMVKSEMGLELNFLELADENDKGLNGVPATVLVEALMSKHLDINNYVWQDDFEIPYQTETSFFMAAEDFAPNNEQEYLSAYLSLRLTIRDVNKDFDQKMKGIRQRGHELIEENNEAAGSIYQLLVLISNELRPFPESILYKRASYNHYHIDKVEVQGNLNNVLSQVNINNNIENPKKQ